MSLIKCTECDKEFKGDQYGESQEFNDHKCIEDYATMPLDDLIKKAGKASRKGE